MLSTNYMCIVPISNWLLKMKLMRLITNNKYIVPIDIHVVGLCMYIVPLPGPLIFPVCSSVAVEPN